MKETLKNLAKAFVGESQARNRYSMYAKIAQKEGYEQIAEIFLITAENEREHAKWLFRLLNQLKSKVGIDKIDVDVSVPVALGSTLENLKAAIEGEHYEHVEMYPKFADIAEQEGLTDIATRLRAIAIAEKHHEERFRKLLMQLEQASIFKKQQEVQWICRKCGYVHNGVTPPEQCPSCSHPKNYFQLKYEEY